MKRVTLIIVNWNSGSLLTQCLTSLPPTDGDIEIEVIVVDNASTDDSLTEARRQFPDFHYILNNSNLGFGAAQNQGFTAGTGDYMVVLNMDTILQPDTVSACVAYMEENLKIGCLGCQLRYADDTLQLSAHQFPTLTRTWIARFPALGDLLPARFQLELSSFDYELTQQVDYVKGAFMFLRKEALDEVGLFDEQFFMYSEETDLCYRLWKHDWQVVYYPGTSIRHLRAQSALVIPVSVTRARRYISRYRFIKKHYGRLRATSYHALTILLMPIKLLFKILLAPVRGFGAIREEAAFFRAAVSLRYPDYFRKSNPNT